MSRVEVGAAGVGCVGRSVTWEVQHGVINVVLPGSSGVEEGREQRSGLTRVGPGGVPGTWTTTGRIFGSNSQDGRPGQSIRLRSRLQTGTGGVVGLTQEI